MDLNQILEAFQRQLMEFHLRLTVMESLLIDNNLVTKEQVQNKITAVAQEMTDQLKEQKRKHDEEKETASGQNRIIL